MEAPPIGMLSINEDEWDDCDIPVSATNTSKKPSKREIYQFTNVDGIKSGLVKALESGKSVQRSKEVLNLDTIIQLPPPNIAIYETSEEDILPPSLLLASRNKLSYDQVLSAQQAVNFSLPYLVYGAFMYPGVLRDATRTYKPLKEFVKTMTPGIVHGMRRHAVQGYAWPGGVRTQDQADSISGMMVFGVSDGTRKFLDHFQAGHSELQVMRASFVLEDGRTCSVDCNVYVTKEKSTRNLLPLSEKVWQVSGLMHDAWHLRNLKRSAAEEEGLREQLLIKQ